MDLPKRAPEHIMETESWKILQASTPSQWIIREVSERDYGIDCYLELVGQDGYVSGDLVSLQLKSTRSIDWTEEKGEGLTATAYSRDIPRSTINYWMALPVPVFLCLADINEKKIYYTNVKANVRSNYGKFSQEASFRFQFIKLLELGSDPGKKLFLSVYSREKRQGNFTHHLRVLLIHWEDYLQFIDCNMNRDMFLEVESDAQIKMVHIYKTCLWISLQLLNKWDQVSLADRYKEDTELWSTEYGVLHEKTMGEILLPLRKRFIKTLCLAKRLVTEEQADYWRSVDPLLYVACNELRFNEFNRLCEE